MKTPKPIKMYDLLYISGGKIKETVMTNKPKPICLWKKNQIKSQYTNRSLEVRPITDRIKKE